MTKVITTELQTVNKGQETGVHKGTAKGSSAASSNRNQNKRRGREVDVKSYERRSMWISTNKERRKADGLYQAANRLMEF